MKTSSDNAYPNKELERMIQQQREDTSRWQNGENHSPNPNVDPNELKGTNSAPAVDRIPETTVESGPPVMVARVFSDNEEDITGALVVLQDDEFQVVGSVATDAENGFLVEWQTGRSSIEKKAHFELIVDNTFEKVAKKKTFKTVQDIKDANEAAGHSFFSPETMNFFKSKVSEKVYPCGVFVTSEKSDDSSVWDGKRRYSVRKITQEGQVDTLSEFGEFESSEEAHEAAATHCRYHCATSSRKSNLVTSSEDSFVPPTSVANAAKRGLELRRKHNRGGTEVGVARARDLSNRKGLSYKTIKRMKAYFDRHEVDKKGEGWGKDSAGYIAWLLWGGDSGRSWANKIVKQHEKKKEGN